MQTLIHSTQHSVLRKFIQAYIFFNHSGEKTISYTTFPNTNLCLALYKNNRINYVKSVKENSCYLTEGKEEVSSRIYAFHQRPFQVAINAPVDQICILFYPSALSAFTKESYVTLLASDNPLGLIFKEDSVQLEQLFTELDNQKRVARLEQLLLKRLMQNEAKVRINQILSYIKDPVTRELKVETLAKSLNINVSTLYRIFFAEIGQSPKSFLQTVRFRHALNDLLFAKHKDLTRIAYANQYYDQAHFIKEFNTLSGETPGKLIQTIALEQQQLAWRYGQNS